MRLVSGAISHHVIFLSVLKALRMKVAARAA
jgi:hypothetical protein